MKKEVRNFAIDPTLHAAAKARAKIRLQSLSAIICRLLEMWLRGEIEIRERQPEEAI